uniref:C-type lectin domain-containing protein n=1 Tax=Sparus aurata TaxID=8175 RepID=A0A671UNG6_SPAAU
MSTLQNLQLRFIYWFLYFFSFSGTKPGPPQYVLFNKVNKWSDARDYCRTSYTDLASVRNEEENQMIKKVSKGKYAWVGVFRDSWVWSDQTYSSFRYWKATKAFSSGITNGCAGVHSAQNPTSRIPPLPHTALTC